MMMNIPFVKMQALGNDFVIMENRFPHGVEAEFFRYLADRRRGIGCDQILIWRQVPDSVTEMEIYNADGSQAEACGNGARCVAWLLMRQNGEETTALRVGPRLLWAKSVGPNLVEVDMGNADLDEEGSQQASKLFKERAVVVSLGNPHLIFFEAHKTVDEQRALFERAQASSLFPKGVNVEFAERLSNQHLATTLWERGVGATQACGSGACAVAYAAKMRGYSHAHVTVSMPGGDVTVEIGNTVKLTGEISFVFRGEIDYNQHG